LLSEIEEKGKGKSKNARFICAMVFLLSPNRFFAVQETLEGEITAQGRGKGGFGYDPLLYLPERGCTVAELPQSEKNKISHRGKAARMLSTLIKEWETSKKI